ncbi:hypothetical protein IWZ03DRAFT_367968 [Phyllosticta citriasiana]|uniref:Uncharacterized protein n=1 Tax=Phyllosticta citriasiana TaxID=595635 RepID=A0ABR1L0W5_9PEZI
MLYSPQCLSPEFFPLSKPRTCFPCDGSHSRQLLEQQQSNVDDWEAFCRLIRPSVYTKKHAPRRRSTGVCQSVSNNSPHPPSPGVPATCDGSQTSQTERQDGKSFCRRGMQRSQTSARTGRGRRCGTGRVCGRGRADWARKTVEEVEGGSLIAASSASSAPIRGRAVPRKRRPGLAGEQHVYRQYCKQWVVTCCVFREWHGYRAIFSCGFMDI